MILLDSAFFLLRETRKQNDAHSTSSGVRGCWILRHVCVVILPAQLLHCALSGRFSLQFRVQDEIFIQAMWC